MFLLVVHGLLFLKHEENFLILKKIILYKKNESKFMGALEKRNQINSITQKVKKLLCFQKHFYVSEKIMMVQNTFVKSLESFDLFF